MCMNADELDSEVSKELLVEHIQEQNELITELQDLIEEQQKQTQIHNSQLSAVNNRLDDAESKIAEQETVIDQMKEIIISNKEVNISPAEQLLSGQDWSELSIPHSKNRERAIEVVRRWDAIADSVRAGERVKVTTLQNTFEWASTYQTTKRVCEFVETLTDKKIILKQNTSGEKILVHPTDKTIHTSIEEALFTNAE